MSLLQTPPAPVSPVVSGEAIPHLLMPAPGLRDRRRRGWSLAVSLLAQSGALALLLWIVHSLPPRPVFLFPETQRHWQVVTLFAPPIRWSRPLPPPRPSARMPRHVIPVPWRARPRSSPRPAPAPHPVLALKMPALNAGPDQPIATLHPRPAAPPLRNPARRVVLPRVQVGSFGSVNGSAAPPLTDAANIPREGTFDSGARPQAPLAPASTPLTGAFAALDGPAHSGGVTATARLRLNLFNPSPPPLPPTAGNKSLQTVHFSLRPPLILAPRPQPVYTLLARRNHVEGDVVLQAVLQRNGTVRILRIVRGLGYGLDDSARAAARQLRFRPALRDGRPVDWTVLLHISFRLAY